MDLSPFVAPNKGAFEMRTSADNTRRRRPGPKALAGWTLALILTIGLSGCGGEGPTGDVQGRLTLQGKPFTEGSVVFFRAVGVPAGVGELGPSGEFSLDEPIPVGEYQVAIQAPEDELPAGAENPNPGVTPVSVPLKYMSETTSGFIARVKEGDNKFTFDMQ